MWFKVDDGFADHDKTALAVDACPGSVALWLMAGARCGKALTDGLVPPTIVTRAGQLAGLTKPLVARSIEALVISGLWHDQRTARRCDHCGTVKLGRDTYLFHDWWDYNPTSDETLIPTERLRWRRKQELKRNRRLCERIVERDRNLCRYCGQRVNWKDRRGALGGTYDHVDPDGPNSMENVVVACRACNGQKRDRTPKEAGMTLLPEPVPYRSGSGSEPDPIQVEPGLDLAPRARHARDGAVQVGSGSDPGSGRVPVVDLASSNGNGHRPSTEGDQQ